MREKRRYIRIDLCTQVEYEVLPMQSSFKTETKNISVGGLCFLVDREIQPGTILHLKFLLPDKEKIYVESLGEVIWQKKQNGGYLTGIEFKNINPQLELKLNMSIINFLKGIDGYFESSQESGFPSQENK